jgi:ABC-type dipeptide/oligopeptide/nickel transport system ATPase component
MSVLQIREAKREGARLVIGIAGVSGSGKTYTALQLAYGLANGNGKKVGFLDTENRRGSLYADSLPQPFLIGDLYAPFAPQRYIDAILEFQQAGVEVLVIDSVTHEWEGVGGCEEIASATRFPDWKRAKAEHKRFMNVMLQSNMHIVACIRAREKVDFSDPKNPRPLGVQPIQEKNFMFEMTASVLMHDAGHRQTVLKCPSELTGILGRGAGYITADDGKALRQWVDGATAIDPDIERHRNSLQTVTESGLDALGKAWMAVPAKVRKALGQPFLDTLKASAISYDQQRSAGKPVAPEFVSKINDETADTGGF